VEQAEPAITGTAQWENRGLWRWFAIPCLLCLASAIALNLWVNPFGLYGSGGFKDEIVNYRQLKLELLRKADPAPTTLILGSSTVMTLAPEKVEQNLGGTAFNFGMTSAQPEDYYSVLRIALDDLRLPLDNVILSLDQCVFNEHFPAVAESRNLAEFRRYFIHHGITADPAHGPLPMLISMEQTHASYRVVRRYIEGRELEDDRVLSNGHVVKEAYDRQIAAGEYDLDAVLDSRVRKRPVRWLRMDEFDRVDPQALDYLDSLLELCSEHGIEVYAYVTPYHPRQWAVLEEFPNVGILEEANAAIASKLESYGYEFHDYSHIESFGGLPELFYDEVHTRPGNQELLIDKLLGTREAGQ
jgi:hypothetical protein